MSFKIREINSNEDTIVLQNWMKMWNDVGIDSNNFVADCQTKTRDFVIHAKQKLGFKLFVAETPDGTIVGSLCCQLWAGPQPCASVSSKIGTVWAVYVEPEYRRQGIATNLMTQCIQHWQQLGCTKAVLIYASEEGKRVYQRLGFRPGCMLAIDLPVDETCNSTPSPALMQEDVAATYRIHRLQDDSHDLMLAANYRRSLQDASHGTKPESFLQANVINETLRFMEDARLRLNFTAFVARNDKGEVIASVCTQVWEGPLPCIVSEHILKFGCMWGLYVEKEGKRDSSAIVSDLVLASTAFLESIGCNKILTLCPSTKMYELLTSATPFHSSNTLVLDIPKGQPMPSTTMHPQQSLYVDGASQEMVDRLRQSHESFHSFSVLELSWLLIANHNQLQALGMNNDTKTSIVQVQKDFLLYQDPNDNWFTRNVARLGKGFDLEKLSTNPQVLATKFDKLAPNYDAWTLGNQSRIESWIVKMARQHKLLKDAHVLDMCCGTGLQGLTLRLCGFEGVLSGADVSPAMIEAAQHRGCYDYLSVANMNEGVQYPSLVADVIICVGAMELLDMEIALATFSRLLKHDGMLWISFQARQDGLTSTAHQNVQGIDKDTMERELKRHGIDIESIDFHSDAFYTPSPELNGKLLPVPYFYVCGRKKAAMFEP